ncbi:hypothetical protein D9M68_949480 [compost metagenome]
MINGYIDHFIEQGRLVRLLSEWSPTLPGYTIYYPDRRRMPRKLRALIDYLRGNEPDVTDKGDDSSDSPVCNGAKVASGAFPN